MVVEAGRLNGSRTQQAEMEGFRLGPGNMLVEVGLTGVKRWGGTIRDEFLPELQGIRGVRVYEEMRKNDPVIGAVLRASRDTLRALKWTAQVADHVDPEDTQAEDARLLVEQCMGDMDHPFANPISDGLSCMPFGWAVLEVTYKQRMGERDDNQIPDSAYDDGRIGWHRIVLRKQDTLHEWVLDEHGHAIAMVQMAAPDFQLRTIPLAKAVHFRIDPEADNPEGTSMLRPCYRPWYLKKNHEEIEGIGAERDLTGIPRMKLPQNATTADKQTALNIVERIAVNEQSGLVLPKGSDEREDWEFDLVSSPGSRQFDSDKVIRRYAGEIATAFLAQFIRLGQDGRTGSFALGSTQKDFFLLALSSIADILEEDLNRQVIPPLMRLNGIPRPYWPSIRHGRIAARELDKFAAVIEHLDKAGVLGPVGLPLVNSIRGELEMPEVSDEEWDTHEEQRGQMASALSKNRPGQPDDNEEDDDSELGEERRWYRLSEDDVEGWLS